MLNGVILLLFISFIGKIASMNKVVLVSATEYEQSKIDAAIEEVFDGLGGAEKVVGCNKNVFIKVNLVCEMVPEKCGTTHPTIVASVAKLLINQCNCTVTVGDSSGAAYTHSSMNSIYKTCGMTAACLSSGATLNQNFESTLQSIKGKVVKYLEIIDAFTCADVVINIGKLKTHAFTGFTGTVKNLYGLIPGLVKAQTHSLYPEIEQFTHCLIDIEQYAAPKIVLHLLDAVVGMEGNGPTNGQPRLIGKIIAGKNPYLVDAVGVSLFADPWDMPLFIKANERGLLSKDFSETDFDFNSLKNHYIKDFKTVTIINTNFTHTGFLKRFLKKEWVTQRPLINKKTCKGCAKCYEHCPQKAIIMQGEKTSKKAYIDTKLCIRCYCCQELCPFNAVKLTKPLLYHIIRLFSGGGKRKRTKQRKDNK